MVARSGVTPDGFRWHLAPCLIALEDEINARYPKRSKRSDGSIASAAHSKQNPTSDHEADRGDGLVKAIDLTDDPPRFDPDDFLDHVITRRDPRVKYVIKDRRIWRSYKNHASHPPAWTPEPYTGANDHLSHAHLSVTDDGANDTSTWFPNGHDAPTPQEDPIVPELEIIKAFDRYLGEDDNGRLPSDHELQLHAWYAAVHGIANAVLNIARSDEANRRRSS